VRRYKQLIETHALLHPAKSANSLVQTYGWGADS